MPTVPSLSVVPLDASLEPAWREFLSRQPKALFYASLDFRDLVRTLLRATPYYLVALEQNRVRGVLPAFAATDSRLGTVLNSLPYYGSNGGVITDGCDAAAEALLAAYLDLERSLDCVASTLVASPFDGATARYERALEHTFLDSRIGQLTPLPARSATVEDDLFARYDESARRNVRKARKSGVTVRESHDEDDIRFLCRTHQENIRQIGGLPKDEAFFQAVHDKVPRSRWSLLVAEKDDERIAGLLTFRFNCTIEYYTPAILEASRPLQGLALLVHHAMCDGARAGYSWWNWGGTWASQEGVYRFKKKWGAQDMPYHYYCRVTDREVLKCSRETLLRSYPGFFVVPFDKLESRVDA